jgi:hypothetical protein
MLSCITSSINCLESSAFTAVNPLWLRWLREQRNSPIPAPVSFLQIEDGKEASASNRGQIIKERGERNKQPRKISGFALFNHVDLEQPLTSTQRPEVTTLNVLPDQPLDLPGVTFANLLERARQRTSEDNTASTTPMDNLEDTTVTLTTTTTTTTTTRTTLASISSLYSLRASSRYKPRSVPSPSSRPRTSQRLISASRFQTNSPRMMINRRRQVIKNRMQSLATTVPTTTVPTTTVPTTTVPTTTVPTTTTTITTTTTAAPTTTSQIYTSLRTSSAMLVTRTVTSTEEAPTTIMASTTTSTSTSTTTTTTTTTTATTTATTTTTAAASTTTELEEATTMPLPQLILSGKCNSGLYLRTLGP